MIREIVIDEETFSLRTRNGLVYCYNEKGFIGLEFCVELLDDSLFMREILIRLIKEQIEKIK